MPPIVERKCPKCQQVNTYDLAELIRTYLPIFAEALAPVKGRREYAVTCRKCGHEFVIRVSAEEVPHE